MREMAAQEVRRGLLGLNKLPNSLRNCVNKELLASSTFNSNMASLGGMGNGGSNGMGNGGSNMSNMLSLGMGLNASTSNRGQGGSPSGLNTVAMAAAAAAASGNPLSTASILSSSANSQQQQFLAQLSCKKISNK